jgi:hypothetical protein
MPENTLACLELKVSYSSSGYSDETVDEFGLLIVVEVYLVEVDVTSFRTPSNQVMSYFSRIMH